VKAVLIRLTGIPTVGDTVILHHTTPRGGRSIGGHIVREGETLSDIANNLVHSCRGGFVSAIDIKAKENKITIICPDVVSDAIFVAEVLGAKTEIMTVEEL
jgi:hypothetical protein